MSIHGSDYHWGAPIPVTYWNELANHARYSSLSHTASHSEGLVSPFAQTFELSGSPEFYRPSPPPRADTHFSDVSHSDISQLSTTTQTPQTTTTGRSFRRSPPPFSDKELTPPQSSYLSRSPRLRQSQCQPSYCEKEIVPPPGHQAYSISPRCYPQTTSDQDMNFFRRRNQQLPTPPAIGERQTSPDTVFRKNLPAQSTGVTDSEEKQCLSSHDSSLSQQISTARTARVNAVVNTYIEPLLHQQASSGLTRSTFVLIPESAASPSYTDSDKAAGCIFNELPADCGTVLSQSETQDMLIGFPAELVVHVVRLRPTTTHTAGWYHHHHHHHTGSHSNKARDQMLVGNEDGGSSRFWHQPAVVAELDRLLGIRLVSMGLDVYDPVGYTAPFRRDGWAARGEHVGGTPNMSVTAPNGGLSFQAQHQQKWKGDALQTELGIWDDGGVSRSRKQATWQEERDGVVLLPGQASVKVELTDVCFRTQSEMGLYDTKTDRALVVKVVIEG